MGLAPHMGPGDEMKRRCRKPMHFRQMFFSPPPRRLIALRMYGCVDQEDVLIKDRLWYTFLITDTDEFMPLAKSFSWSSVSPLSIT